MERRNALLILLRDRWRIFAFERRRKMTYQSKKHKEVFDKAMVKKNEALRASYTILDTYYQSKPYTMANLQPFCENPQFSDILMNLHQSDLQFLQVYV